MDLLHDPVLLRGIERILIVVGAIGFGFLGYKLFRLGIDKGNARLSSRSTLIRLTFSGTGPGLFFMAFGAFVLAFALWTGGASIKKQETTAASGARKGVAEMKIYTVTDGNPGSVTFEKDSSHSKWESRPMDGLKPQD